MRLQNMELRIGFELRLPVPNSDLEWNLGVNFTKQESQAISRISRSIDINLVYG